MSAARVITVVKWRH